MPLDGIQAECVIDDIAKLALFAWLAKPNAALAWLVFPHIAPVTGIDVINPNRPDFEVKVHVTEVIAFAEVDFLPMLPAFAFIMGRLQFNGANFPATRLECHPVFSLDLVLLDTDSFRFGIQAIKARFGLFLGVAIIECDNIHIDSPTNHGAAGCCPFF